MGMDNRSILVDFRLDLKIEVLIKAWPLLATRREKLRESKGSREILFYLRGK